MKFSTACAAMLLAVFSTHAFAEGDAASGEKVFKKRCKACHMIGDGAKNKVGPMLTNVFGAKIGSTEKYKYSNGYIELGEKDVVWAEDNLMEYLVDPKGFLKDAGVKPKSKMTYKLKKEADRADVIAYLKSFSESE